jgi:hypothetical protein
LFRRSFLLGSSVSGISASWASPVSAKQRGYANSNRIKRALLGRHFLQLGVGEAAHEGTACREDATASSATAAASTARSHGVQPIAICALGADNSSQCCLVKIASQVVRSFDEVAGWLKTMMQQGLRLPQTEFRPTDPNAILARPDAGTSGNRYLCTSWPCNNGRLLCSLRLTPHSYFHTHARPKPLRCCHLLLLCVVPSFVRSASAPSRRSSSPSDRRSAAPGSMSP